MPEETGRISVSHARCAATADAAYQDHMDHDIGSAACGTDAGVTARDSGVLNVTR